MFIHIKHQKFHNTLIALTRTPLLSQFENVSVFKFRFQNTVPNAPPEKRFPVLLGNRPAGVLRGETSHSREERARSRQAQMNKMTDGAGNREGHKYVCPHDRAARSIVFLMVRVSCAVRSDSGAALTASEVVNFHLPGAAIVRESPSESLQNFEKSGGGAPAATWRPGAINARQAAKRRHDTPIQTKGDLALVSPRRWKIIRADARALQRVKVRRWLMHPSGIERVRIDEPCGARLSRGRWGFDSAVEARVVKCRIIDLDALICVNVYVICITVKLATIFEWIWSLQRCNTRKFLMNIGYYVYIKWINHDKCLQLL